MHINHHTYKYIAWEGRGFSRDWNHLLFADKKHRSSMYSRYSLKEKPGTQVVIA
jgi:hypothetical protein